MPVSYNSAARNLFLLGSSGQQVAQNFFKYIDKDNGSGDGYIDTEQIRYIDYDDKYIIAGSGRNLNLVGYGFFDKRDYDQETDPENPTTTLDYEKRIVSTGNSAASNFVFLENIHVDSNGDLIACGIVDGTTPWIGKYSYSTGNTVWQSTSNQGSINYRSVTSDSSGYYACGHSAITGEAVVEKYDLNGNPLWGKKVSTVGGSQNKIQLFGIASNSRGQLVAVGDIVDIDQTKGYMIKFTTSGEFLWDKSLQADLETSSFDHQTRLEGIHIDDKDQIYVSGHIQSTQNFFRDADRTGWVGKYTAEGNLIWQRESNNGAGTHMTHRRIAADDQTEQVIVLSAWSSTTDDGAALSKYSKNGTLLWRRSLISDSSAFVDSPVLDADSSFYYLAFTDEDRIFNSNTPEGYIFGKVSTSGNGLGAFQYPDGSGVNQGYEILNLTDKIGRLDDGSVRFDSSDLRKTPFSANHIVFDDYATQVTKKKVNIKDTGVIQYSGSPAIRPTDFQEMNLLGDVYSGSGDWLDQSGQDNDVTTSFTTTTTSGGNTSSENYYDGGGLYPSTTTYSTYGTVVEDVTTTLPYSNSDWTHYGGKARDLQSGGFKITFSDNSAASEFFMGCWVKFDTYATSKQMGVNLFGNYVYWETLANGNVAIRHNGGSRQDTTGGTGIDDGNWHYISLSRQGNTLAGCVDGTAVITTTNGVSGNSVPANADFWFFGGSGTAYNIDGKILDPIIAVNSGNSGGTFLPTKPLIDSSFNFNNGGSGTGPFFLSPGWSYASPAISLGGGTVTTTTGPTYNSAGYWDFNGTTDKMFGPPCNTILSADSSIELWVNFDDVTTRQTIISGYDSTPNTNPDRWDFEMSSGTFRGGFHNNGYFSSTTAINTGEWHHVMLVLDSGSNTLKFYLDGVENVSQSCSGFDFGGPDVDLGIGDRYESSIGPMNGKVGEVRIYPRALPAAQAFQNYNATKSKYINEAPDTAPKIGPNIVTDSYLLLNYDFGNRATYDRAQNLIPNSEDFTKWNQAIHFWENNYAIAPDGTKTAALLKESIPAQQQLSYHNIGLGGASLVVGETYTYTVYAKANTRDTFEMHMYGDSNASFNLTTGSSTSTSSMTDVGDGWWLCKWVREKTDTAGIDHVYIGFSGSTYAGAGVDESIFIWRPQFERGDVSRGRYIKTSGVSITAPTTVKNLSGSSIPGTIDSAEFNNGGWFEFTGPTSSSTRIAFDSSSVDLSGSFSIDMWFRQDTQGAYHMLLGSQGYGAAGNGIGHYLFGNTIRTWVQEGSNTAVNIWDSAGTTTFTQNVWYNLVLLRESGTAWRWYLNGSLVNSNTTDSLTADFTTPNTYIGDHYNTSIYHFDGDIGALRMYSRALSATEVLQNFNATRGKYGV